MTFNDLISSTLVIQRGSVFKWDEYDFSEDGVEYQTRDKYWITLNCKINDFPINAVLPTSQHDNHYYSKPANLIDTVVITPGESRHFTKQTIIDLKNIIIEDEYIIRQAYDDGYLYCLGDLEINLLKRIEDTIKNSSEIEPFKIAEYLCEEGA